MFRKRDGSVDFSGLTGEGVHSKPFHLNGHDFGSLVEGELFVSFDQSMTGFTFVSIALGEELGGGKNFKSSLKAIGFVYIQG